MLFKFRHIFIGAGLFGTVRIDAQTNVVAPVPSPAFSIGQPSRWQHALSVVAPLNQESTHGPVWLSYDLRRALVNPVAGLLNAGIAGYTALGSRNYGGRVVAGMPLFGLSGGADWNIPSYRLSPIFTFETALRRGGILGHGAMVRVDWLPTRRQTATLGI